MTVPSPTSQVTEGGQRVSVKARSCAPRIGSYTLATASRYILLEMSHLLPGQYHILCRSSGTQLELERCYEEYNQLDDSVVVTVR